MRALSAEKHRSDVSIDAGCLTICHDWIVHIHRDHSSADFETTPGGTGNQPEETLKDSAETANTAREVTTADAENDENRQPAATGKKRHGLLRNLWWIVPGIVFPIVCALITLIPVPYVVNAPGPTINILGTHEGAPTIQISGNDPKTGKPVELDPVHETEQDDGDRTGQLRMVTVLQRGGPGNSLATLDLIRAWFSGHDEIIPYREVFPPDVTSEEAKEAAQMQMKSSESAASVVALEHLGWDVPADVQVEGAVPGSDAVGKVEQGDQIESITTPDGTVHPVDSGAVPFALMRTVPPDSQMTLTVVRNGKTIDIPIVSSKKALPDPDSEEATSSSLLGVYLSVHPQLPLDIDITLQDVGGPSAGMMFALGIYDRLTPGDLTGGVTIAGTGALSFNGQVEPIGGIQQKMVGANNDGAQWFLAPGTNCDEVVGHIPDGLNVTRVDTFDDALTAVTAIAAGTTDSLPTCESR